MPDRVRLRKLATRCGRPEALDVGPEVVDGFEVAPPSPGMAYVVSHGGTASESAVEAFSTTPVRVVIIDRKLGMVTLLTDNSRYAVEIVGR